MKVDEAVKESVISDDQLIVTAFAIVSRARSITPSALAQSIGVKIDRLVSLFDELETAGIYLNAGLLSIQSPSGGRISHKVFGNEWTRLGLIADTHYACIECREDEIENTYDLYEREGITDVYHAGNPVDGYIEKINATSVHCTTPDDQAEYFVDHLPRRKGITTHFITGDDHEGWWIKKGVNWGKIVERIAEEKGRKDIVYLGHVEADIAFVGEDGQETIVKIQHPGGGAPYARSYAQQKQIESFEGGEKPHILVQGHHHVSNYMQDRNTHCLLLPGFQDQTIFARKKRLRMEVGCNITEFTQLPEGGVARFRTEFFRYFTRGFYRRYLKNDTMPPAKRKAGGGGKSSARRKR